MAIQKTTPDLQNTVLSYDAVQVATFPKTMEEVRRVYVVLNISLINCCFHIDSHVLPLVIYHLFGFDRW